MGMSYLSSTFITENINHLDKIKVLWIGNVICFLTYLNRTVKLNFHFIHSKLYFL